MIRLVRRPTVWTGVALLGYLAILWFAYHEGNYCHDQDRDVWIATPFMLAPFFLPLVIQKISRMYWICYAAFSIYTITPYVVYITFNINYMFDNSIMLYYAKWIPTVTDKMTFTEWFVGSIALNLLASGLYGLIGVLAAKTYRLAP